MEIKIKCIGCSIRKSKNEYWKDSKRLQGVTSRCKPCFLKQQQERRKRNNYCASKKYEKTINGFLMRAYRNMKSRVVGLVKPHIYQDLEIISKKEFYKFSIEDKNFIELYAAWKDNNFDRKLSPSVNRINPEKGYTIDNIEWTTHSYNSANTRRWKNNES